MRQPSDQPHRSRHQEPPGIGLSIGPAHPVPYLLPRPPHTGELALGPGASEHPATVTRIESGTHAHLAGQPSPIPLTQLCAATFDPSAIALDLTPAVPSPRTRAHQLIEGENAHVADLLLANGHAGRYDVIYLDPPYDTGTALTYTDNRASWPDFFHARLERARELLHPTRGILIVAIDDRRLPWARILTDELLGPEQFIAAVVWDGGVHGQSRLVSVAHDYMLIYAANAAALRRGKVTWREPRPGVDQALQRARTLWATDPDPTRAHTAMLAWYRSLGTEHPAKKLAEYSWFEPGTGRLLRPGPVCKPHSAHYDYDVTHPVTGATIPRPGKGYRYSPETMAQLIAEDRILFRDDPTKGIATKLYLDELGTQAPHAVFTEARTRAAKRLAAQIGAGKFTYPKDPTVLARWFALVTGNRPDARILDLFAGSGSTGEAVMRMNQHDGGERVAVCVTNNEVPPHIAAGMLAGGASVHDPAWHAQGAFETVTRPRLELVAAETRQTLSVSHLAVYENDQVARAAA